MPRLSAAWVKLPISATVMNMRIGSRFCMFVPGIVHYRENSEFISSVFIIPMRHSKLRIMGTPPLENNKCPKL
jgi:hypothetical protein